MINYITRKQEITEGAISKERYIRLRMYIISSLCFVGLTVVLGRTVYLHLADNEQLARVANGQYNAKIPVNLRRGKIFDRNGSELAVSLPVPTVYVDPTEIKEPATVAKELGKVLNVREKPLLEKLSSDRRYVSVKRWTSYDTLEKVLALKLPGVHYMEESKRFYPNGELGSQILGAVGYDSQALAGIEMAFNDVLISKKKSNYFKRDAKGRMYATPVAFGEQSDVGEVYLTIDKQIQFIAENALRDAVKKFKANDGVAVVIDVSNGDVLAMASAPVFDPNRYSKYPQDRWRNRAVTDMFEPGSTFKVFIVAAALQAGIVDPKKTYHCGNGSIKIGKDVLNDHHPYGELTVEDIIKRSSNIGALKIAFDLGKERLYESLKRFGIGNRTGIKFPGEADGLLRDYKTWQPIEQATVAFGQGLAATPLQMTAAFASVVNGGKFYRPGLISKMVDRNGKMEYASAEVVSEPISPGVSLIMREILRRVVETGGTGVNARSEAYNIGGKTGTAQKVVGGSGYAKGKYYASFIGFAPVEDPKLVALVGIDEPKGAYYGGTVAAPAVKEILERSLHYIGVPSLKSPVIYAEKNTVKYSVNPNSLEEIRKKTRFQRIEKDNFIMPDLTGLTMREILTAARDAKVETETYGSGVAVVQNPEPGKTIKSGEKFTVRLELPR